MPVGGGRARAGFEIDHSERSSRVAISRAAGPDGARNTSGATSTQHPATTQRKRAAARQGRRAFTQLVRTRHRREVEHSAQSLGHDLSDLDRVEGSALAQVVTGDDQDEAALAVNRLILADAAHEDFVAAGGQASGQNGGRKSGEKRRISWHLLAAQATCQ